MSSLRDALARVLHGDSTSDHAGQIVALVGSSSSGRTTLAVQLCQRLLEHDRKVTVVDLSPIAPKTVPCLSSSPTALEPLVASAASVLPQSSSDSESDLLPPTVLDPVYLVPGPLFHLALQSGFSAPLDPRPLVALLSQSANRSHFVLVTGVDSPSLAIELVRCADLSILTFEPTLASLGVTARLLAVAPSARRLRLVQCLLRSPRPPLSPPQVEYSLSSRTPHFVIPHDRALAGPDRGLVHAPSRRTRSILDDLASLILSGLPSDPGR